MIIDIQVFEFSNTCTVGASMAVVRLTSMEALILSVTVYIDPSPQPTSGKRPCARVPTGHCLRTNGTSEWMPTAGKRPCARVPTGHCLRTSGVHRSQPPADRRQAAVCSSAYRPLLADQWCTSIPAPSRPPASGRALKCLPATACGPTAPVVYIDPSRPPASGRVLEYLPATACGPTAPVVYIDPSRPLASGHALKCLPATACGPTAPVVYIDPSPQLTAGKRLCARVPTSHCLRTNGTSGVHRSQPPADRWQAAVCSSAYRPLLADQRHQWCTSIPAPS